MIEILWYFLVLEDMMSDLNMSHGKKSHFVSFPFFDFTLVIILRNFNFVIRWNNLIIAKNYGIRFEYVLCKSVWFCFIYIVCVHFSDKTEKYWLLKSLQYFDILFKKWCQTWICPVNQCLIWLLAISWEIRILKLIEIV